MKTIILFLLPALLLVAGCASRTTSGNTFLRSDTLHNSLNHGRIVLDIYDAAGKDFVPGDSLSPDGKFRVQLSPPRANTAITTDGPGKEQSYKNVYGELIISREGRMLRDTAGNMLPDVYYYFTDCIGIAMAWKDSSTFVLKAHPIRRNVAVNAKGDLEDVVEEGKVVYREFRLQ